jgi:hypothetical protein
MAELLRVLKIAIKKTGLNIDTYENGTSDN